MLQHRISAQTDGKQPPTADMQRAERHVAHCGDCWAKLVRVSRSVLPPTNPALADRPPPPRCEEVTDEMWRFVGVTPAEVIRRHPRLARHVEHIRECSDCAESLAEILQVAEADQRGEFDVATAGAAPSPWAERGAEIGKTIRTAIGHAVIRLRDASATFASVPAALFLAPALASGPRRGEAGDGSGLEPSRAWCPLPDSGAIVELDMQASRGGKMRLDVRYTPAAPDGLVVRLRRPPEEGAELLGSRSGLEADPAVFRELPPGVYLLEIDSPKLAARYQIGIEVKRPP